MWSASDVAFAQRTAHVQRLRDRLLRCSQALGDGARARLAERAVLLDQLGHQLRHALVRLAEGYAVAHEHIGEVGREQETLVERLQQAIASPGQRAHQVAAQLERVVPRVERVEERLFVFLHIFGIGQRCTLHRRQQRHQIAIDAPRLTANQLQRVGIFLLRHHARPRRKGIGQLDKGEFSRRPDDQIFAEPTQVHHENGQRRQRFEYKVAIAYRIEAIGRHGRKAQLPAQKLAVYGKSTAGQRARTQRHIVGPLPGIGQASAVALEHPKQRQSIVGKEDGLRLLQMGIARQHGVNVALGRIDQDPLQGDDASA